MRVIEIGDIKIGGNNQIVLFGGPCVIESEEHLLTVDKKIKEVTTQLNISYILKTSFDKANRFGLRSSPNRKNCEHKKGTIFSPLEY
ncbi:2-dehydro-3-deoxyphosphooctonate aldolase [subsurface metagenome]